MSLRDAPYDRSSNHLKGYITRHDDGSVLSRRDIRSGKEKEVVLDGEAQIDELSGEGFCLHFLDEGCVDCLEGQG